MTKRIEAENMSSKKMVGFAADTVLLGAMIDSEQIENDWVSQLADTEGATYDSERKSIIGMYRQAEEVFRKNPNDLNAAKIIDTYKRKMTKYLKQADQAEAALHK